MKKSRFVAAAVLALAAVSCGGKSQDTANLAKQSAELALNNIEEAVALAEDFSAEVGGTVKGKQAEKQAKDGKKSTMPNSEDDFEWLANDELTEITITKYRGSRTDVVIPASIQDVPVTRIAASAFENQYAAGGYTLDYGVAAQVSNLKWALTSIVIPESVKIIEDGAFAGCSYLTSITLPENIGIGYGAFAGCPLQSVEIPKGCRIVFNIAGRDYAIGASYAGVFEGCKELEFVTLPDDLKIIPENCFKNCESLSKINWPSSLKAIQDGAFSGCPLTSVDLPEGLEYLGKSVFSSDAITSVSIPKSLKWIEYYHQSSVISGDNIETITIADGCVPYCSDINGESAGGRDLIKGKKISGSIKLQKCLKEFTLYGKTEYSETDFKLACACWNEDEEYLVRQLKELMEDIREKKWYINRGAKIKACVDAGEFITGDEYNDIKYGEEAKEVLPKFEKLLETYRGKVKSEEARAELAEKEAALLGSDAASSPL